MVFFWVVEEQVKFVCKCFYRVFVFKVIDNKEVEVIVMKIVGGDIIIVCNKIGVEKRISLSSVCGFCVGEVLEVLWREEVKEFLCKKFIGKYVKVFVDGIKFVIDDFEVCEVVIVIQSGKNIGLQFVEGGYVIVICYCKDDIDCVFNYDEFLVV